MNEKKQRRKWNVRFDPRTKIILLIISMIIATTISSLYYECILIALIATVGVACGKIRYTVIGTGIYIGIYLFSIFYLQNISGIVYTMFMAWLSLIFKVYPCGMLAGIVVSTTKVNEFLSAMSKIHISKKLPVYFK